MAIVKRTRRRLSNDLLFDGVGRHRVNRIFALVEIETRAGPNLEEENPWLLASNRADLIVNRRRF